MKKKFSEMIAVLYRYVLDHKRISVVALLVVASLGYYFFSKTTSAIVTYQYTKVRRGTITQTVSGTGQVISNSQVDLKPKVNANITNVYVHAGDRVKTGQVLFRLDATDAYKQVRDAKTALVSANIALEKLKNPKAADVIALTNSIKQEEDSKKVEDQKVATAYRTLLNANLQALPDGSYTAETAPTLSGSYTKDTEGQININVYQGGTSGYTFSATGITSGTNQVNTSVAMPIGDSGLYIKWNSSAPQTNWVISVPNKQSTSYASNYAAWQNAVANRDINNAASDRNIASLKQKLADLSPSDDNLDVRSAMLQVEQRQNALADAQQSLSNYTIVAPFDGVMANVSVDIGSSAVMASANSSAALGTIVTDKKLAQITVNESDIVKIKLGQKATLSFDAVDGLIVDGTVVEINTLGTVTSGVVTYKAKIAFSADDARILPNMSVTADVITDSKDDVLYLQSQAVKHDKDGYYIEKDASAVLTEGTSTRRINNGTSSENGFIRSATSTWSASSSRRRMGNGSSSYQRNGPASNVSSSASITVTRIPVTVGIKSDTQTEILSGLNEGDTVILKTITGAAAKNAAAPSVTSLLRPQGGGRPAGAGSARPQ